MCVRRPHSSSDQRLHHVDTTLVHTDEDCISVLAWQCVWQICKFLSQTNHLALGWRLVLAGTRLVVMFKVTFALFHIHIIEAECLAQSSVLQMNRQHKCILNSVFILYSTKKSAKVWMWLHLLARISSMAAITTDVVLVTSRASFSGLWSLKIGYYIGLEEMGKWSWGGVNGFCGGTNRWISAWGC